MISLTGILAIAFCVQFTAIALSPPTHLSIRSRSVSAQGRSREVRRGFPCRALEEENDADEGTKELIAAQQKQIDKLMELLDTKSASAYDDNQSQGSIQSSASLPPLKVMLFIDGTWLYYSLHGREDSKCTLQQRFGRGWQHKYNVDWGNLPRVISQALQQQERDRGWMPLSSSDGEAPTRPVEVVRVSVFTSYRADTPHTSLRYQMFQDMLKAKYDVMMLETMGRNEKCVDIQLAVDMLHYATVPDAYDVAVLLSGDKDYIPAMVRCRQKGRRVGLVSMKRYCTRAFYETPNVKDYDVIWMDDFLDKIIKPKKDSTLLQGNRPRPQISLHTLMKLANDFIIHSDRKSVSSRDLGRYMKSLTIGSRNVLDEVKEIFGGMYQFLIVSEIFDVNTDTVERDFWVKLNDRFEDEMNAALLEAKPTSFEKDFFGNYNVDIFRNKKKLYEFTLGSWKPDNEEDEEAIHDYNSHTVSQLKDLCRELNLPVSGRKAELVERIVLKQKEASEAKQSEAEQASASSDDLENQIKEYLEGLLDEYLHATGGKASSRDVGRYLTANKASHMTYSRDRSIRSALSELKNEFGSLKQFITQSSKFSQEDMEDGDAYEFLVSNL